MLPIRSGFSASDRTRAQAGKFGTRQGTLQSGHYHHGGVRDLALHTRCVPTGLNVPCLCLSVTAGRDRRQKSLRD